MLHPALTVQGVDSDYLLAVVDDLSPLAIETHGADSTVFFADAANRDAAREAVKRTWPDAFVTSHEVDDEDWARRSQENLPPVTVGRLTIVAPGRPAPPEAAQTIVIAPSTGFGTGHHQTTRLCLAALQTVDLAGRTLLDVGTGSGILAIAASVLGASSALGIDHDPDAIQAARENLSLNPAVKGVSLDIADVAAAQLPQADVVTANLTGALLQRSAPTILSAVRPGGRLIISGVLQEERAAVLGAFAPATRVWETAEDEWVGLLLEAPAHPTGTSHRN